MIVERPPRSWERLARIWARVYRSETASEARATRTFDLDQCRRLRTRAERLRRIRIRVECLRHSAPAGAKVS